MPIRKEFRHFYQGPEWQAARQRCRERAGDRCERCGAPNGTTVLRAYEYWTPATLQTTVFMLRGTIAGEPITVLPWHHKDTIREAHFPLHDWMKFTGIQCGAAHLNNQPGDDRDENLAWLCRGCHLNYDRLHHRQTRAARKDKGRPLLQLAEPPDKLSPCHK